METPSLRNWAPATQAMPWRTTERKGVGAASWHQKKEERPTWKPTNVVSSWTSSWRSGGSSPRGSPHVAPGNWIDTPASGRTTKRQLSSEGSKDQVQPLVHVTRPQSDAGLGHHHPFGTQVVLQVEQAGERVDVAVLGAPDVHAGTADHLSFHALVEGLPTQFAAYGQRFPGMNFLPPPRSPGSSCSR